MKENGFNIFFSNSGCLIEEEGGGQGGLEHYTTAVSEGHWGTKLITSDSLHYGTILIWRNYSVNAFLMGSKHATIWDKWLLLLSGFLLDLIQLLVQISLFKL